MAIDAGTCRAASANQALLSAGAEHAEIAAIISRSTGPTSSARSAELVGPPVAARLGPREEQHANMPPCSPPAASSTGCGRGDHRLAPSCAATAKSRHPPPRRAPVEQASRRVRRPRGIRASTACKSSYGCSSLSLPRNRQQHKPAGKPRSRSDRARAEAQLGPGRGFEQAEAARCRPTTRDIGREYGRGACASPSRPLPLELGCSRSSGAR